MAAGDAMDVVAAVFTDGDLVLAGRRKPYLAAGGRWEFPGGKTVAGEAPQAALEREIREELSVEIEVGDLADLSATMVNGTLIRLACYFVRPLAEVPATSTDHDVVSWFRRERLMWLDWAEPDLPCVRRLAFAAS